MKYFKHITLLVLLASCSNLEHTTHSSEFSGERTIAEETTCAKSLENFFKNEVTEEDLNTALKERKLISFKDKMLTVNYPKLDWFSDVKKSLMTRIKNWNRNQYPLFYLDTTDEVLPLAKSYADLIAKDAAGTISDEEKKSLTTILEWIDSYKNYQHDLDNLLEERISLQYNIKMLKEIKLDKNEVREIKLTIKKDGEFKSEIITLRDEDKNLDFVINKYKDLMKELDGKVNGFGKIEERVVKQAISFDVLNIFQRELEYAVKNNPNSAPELIAHLTDLNTVLKDAAYEPSSYGVYKVTSHVFKKELAGVFSFTQPLEKATNEGHAIIKNQIQKLFSKSDIISKIVKDVSPSAGEVADTNNGPLKKVYAKVATFTPYQKVMASTKLAMVGYGAYRYFIFKKDPPKMVVITTPGGNTPVATEPTHQEQVDNTAKVQDAGTEGHSSVVEVHLENLVKGKNLRN